MEEEFPVLQEPLDEVTISDESPPELPVSLNDPTLPRPPSTPLAEDRAARTSYALGDKSPGPEVIKSQLLAGQEPMLRQQVAANQDYEDTIIKNQLVHQLALSNGGAIDAGTADIVYGLTTTDLRNNPGKILEEKFANKFINDISLAIPFETWSNNPDIEQNDVVGRDIATFHQWSVNQYQDLQTQWDESTWFSKFKSFAVGLLPILPWYRQAQALNDRPSHFPENWGMGETVADNVQAIYSLPIDQRIAASKRAITYLKENGNLLDAMTLAQALISYSTSDRYLANAISIADYTTLASPFISGAIRLAGRAGRAASVAEKEVLSGVKTPTVVPKQLEYQGSNKFTTQGELPGFERPAQGELFEGAENLGTKPIPLNKGSQLVYRGPDGKMRSRRPAEPTEVSPTGIFRDKGTGRFGFDTGSMRQLELDLPPGEAKQLEFALFNRKTPKDGGDIELTPRPPSGGTPPAEEVRQHARVMADGIKAMEGRTTPDPTEVAAAIGDTMAAAAGKALQRFSDVNPTGLGSVAKQIKDLLDPENWLRGGRTISAGLVEDMSKAMIRESDKLIGAIAGQLARVNRLTPEALAIGIENAKAALQRDFGRLGRAVVRTQYLPAEFHPANVDTLSYIIHKPDGALFESKAQALIYRDEHYNLGEAAIPREQGKGWYLEIPQTIDETAPNVVEAMKTVLNRSDKGLSNIIGRFLRTSKDILPVFQNENRNIVAHVPQKLTAEIKRIAEDKIAKLSKKERNAVNDMLVINRDNPAPGSNNPQRGFWYKNAGEWETAYFDKHSRMPTPAETTAYFTYKRLHDFELLMENTAVYRDKARLGVQQFQFQMYKDETGVTTPWFEGIKLDKMPWSLGNKVDQDAGIWVQDGKKGQFYYKFNMTDEERKFVDGLVSDHGYSVIHVLEPTKHPLEGLATTLAKDELKEQVNYIITNTIQRKPLSWEQVKYREGPHSAYVHDWYISQPVIREGRNGKLTFYGDNNVLNIETEAQARKWAPIIDHGRQLLKAGKMDDLKTHLTTKTPYSLDQFLDLFRRSDSPLSLDHPVLFKQRGRTTFDTNELKTEGYSNVIDGRKNVHDPSNLMDKSFLMDRDEVINTINERTWQLAPAMQIDPYTVLNQVIGQRIRNIWANDYKISAITSWVKDFEHVLKPTEKQLLGHPMYFLFHPEYINAAATQMGDLAAAKAARQAILNFIGAKTEIGRNVDAFKMHLLNTVYSVTGQGKMLDLAVATTADPVQFLRAVAFHSKLGLFNPVQLFLQANQMAHSIAVSGAEHGIPGMSAAFLMRRLGHNPNALDQTAKIATKFGWKADQFKEMYEAFQRTGIYQVAGEAALRDDVFDPHLFRGMFGRIFLDGGSMFFNEGERLGRLTAFATAYKDFRKANPSGRIGNRELAKIMNRADDLAGNMTVASKAAWQNGVWSLPTQFATWTARMQEQLLTGALHDITGGAVGRAGRLTGAEKLRMLSTYSLLYGVPIGMGTAVGGMWPVYDSIKKEAQLRGINLNDGWFEPLTQGLLETSFHYLTGRQYNIPQRFGPGNSNTVRDALFGDKPLIESFFGASGTIVGDILRTTAPFYHAIASTFTGREYQLTTTDWFTVFRNSNTVDLATKMTYIVSYGQWLTKTGTVVDDKIDGIDAAAAALGLTPMKVSDTFLKRTALKEEREDKAAIQQQIVETLRKAFNAGSRGEWDAYHVHRAQAQTIAEAGDLNIDQQRAAYDRAINELYTLKDKVDWDASRTAPQSRTR